MTKEEADLAQRYNVGVMIKEPEYEGKMLFIKEFIRWRDPRLNNQFAYSLVLWNKNEPRHSLVQIDIGKVEIMTGFKQFIESKLKERADKQAFEELKEKLKIDRKAMC